MDEPRPEPDYKPAPAPTGPTAMDVVRPAPHEAPAPAEQAEHHEPEKPAKPVKQPKPPKPPKQRNGNVVAAIFATVIIVLGLAALATYAYLKQTT